MKNRITAAFAISLFVWCTYAQAMELSWPRIKKSLYEHKGALAIGAGVIVAIGYLYRYYPFSKESLKAMPSSKKTETLNGFPTITASIKFTNDPIVQRLTIELRDEQNKKLGHAQGLHTQRDGAILSTIWLIKEAQNKRYGSALFKLFMNEFKNNLPACKTITWIATPMNSADKKADQEKLVRFYQREGAIIIPCDQPDTVKMSYTL